jgi:hypothetical protein
MHANQDKSSKSKLLLTSISAMKRKAKAKPKALKASKPKEARCGENMGKSTLTLSN